LVTPPNVTASPSLHRRTFEPSIDIDEAVITDYIRRAADLAVLPTGARRSLALAAPERLEE
jgi:hypothetical protein